MASRQLSCREPECKGKPTRSYYENDEVMVVCANCGAVLSVEEEKKTEEKPKEKEKPKEDNAQQVQEIEAD